ncbi:hypothetical protein GCM10028805_62910 [Spirosoma harenae]
MTSTNVNTPLATNRWTIVPVDQLLWQMRGRILRVTIACAVLGILVSFALPPEFRSEARIVPEMNTGANDLFKRLSSVAGFADFDFSDTEGMDAIRPDLYPNVLQSTSFILYLIRQPIITSDGQEKTIDQFLLPDSSGWFFKRLSLFLVFKKPHPVLADKLKGTVCLSMRQQELAEEISERVSAKLDTRSGIITIITQMPDAQVAALVTRLAMDYLTDYVIKYRTEKARQDLAFYRNQLTEARQRYQRAQWAVFYDQDNHKNIVRQTATLNRRQLESELAIAENIYSELSRRYEQAKLKVQERTPVLKILEAPKVPLKRTSPRRVLIVLTFCFLGLLAGVLSVLIQHFTLIEKLKMILTVRPISLAVDANV